MGGKKPKAAKDAKGKGKDKNKAKAKGRKSTITSLSEVKRLTPAPPPLPPPPPPKPDPCELYVPDESFENVTCKFNDYPGLLEKPKPMSIVGSETGSYKSLIHLLEAGLRCADRCLVMTPWGNYVVFRANRPSDPMKPLREYLTYFLYDGCTCNVNSFRHLDLREGAAGFITFNELNPLVAYMINSRYRREKLDLVCKQVLDDICIEKRPLGETPKELLRTSQLNAEEVKK